MRELVLAEHRAAMGAATRPQKVEIARFKDENASTARVVAASQAYIVYSLKTRSALRVLPRQAQKQTTQISYKVHTASVNNAQFVNVRSNMVASTSENELLVWYVDEDCAVYTYFTFARNVVSFAWVPVANQPPDLLVMIDEGEKKKAAMLKASNLIVQSTKTEDGGVGKPDGLLKADDSNLTLLRSGIEVTVGLTSAASPVFAFSASSDSIVTASLGNSSTPAWKPCDGEIISAMSVMPNELLVAVGATAMFVWDVAAEPQPLQRLLLGPRRCLALHCTSSRATMCLSSSPTACEAFTFIMQPKQGAVAAAVYEVDAIPTPIGSCVVPGATDDPRLHVNADAVLQVYLLQDAPWKPLDAVKAPASAAQAKQPSPPPYTSPHQVPVVPTAVAPLLPPRPLGLSPAAAAFGATPNPELDGLKAHIEAALANTASMLNVSQNVISKDHSALVQEALKAQAKALAAMAAIQPRAGPASGSANAFDAVIDGISEPVAMALVEGISAAIEDQLRTQLNEALRSVLTKQEKRKQKDQAAELKGAVDGIVADVMAAVQQTVQEKQVAYASRLIHYVSDVAGEGGAAVNQLQQVIVAQQQQLQAITQSGLLEEIKQLRAEVAQLKSRSVPLAGNTAPADVPRETVLANAQQHLAAGDHMTGLNWVVQYDDPALVTQLLINCSGDTRNAMLEDAAIPDSMWSRLLSCLASTPKKETLEPSLEWLCDIAAEKDHLLRNDQLAVAVNNFVNSWKSAGGLSGAAKDKLRQLVMLVRLK